MRWKILCFLLLSLLLITGVLLIQAGIKAKESDDIIDKYAKAELERQDYVPGKFETPKIPDVLPGTKAIVHATGSVHYAPMSGAPSVVVPLSPGVVAGVRTAPQDQPGSPPTPCSLNDLDVTLRCSLDALATPTRPWGKLMTSGTIKAWGQTRELPETAAGDVHLSVAPSVAVPKWHMDLLGGIAAGSRIGFEVGTSWTGKSRFGPYVLVEWQPSTGGSTWNSYSDSMVSTGEPATWRLHGGIRVRLK